MTAKPPSDAHGSPIERLLRAAAPSLEAELGHMLAEHEQRLEAQATVRIRTAVLEKEAELRTKAEAESARLRGELTERVRSETARALETQFEEKLSAELRALKERLDQAAQEARITSEDEKSALQAEMARWRALAGFYRQTSGVVSQTEILGQFLQAADHFTEGAALYLNKTGGLTRWQGGGDAQVFPDLISEETRDPDWYWVPITIRSRMVVTVAAAGVSNRETLDALVGGLKHAIENIGLRIGARTSPTEAPEAASPAAESRLKSVAEVRVEAPVTSDPEPVASDSMMPSGPDGAI
jgi:hypothetical protein